MVGGFYLLGGALEVFLIFLHILILGAEIDLTLGVENGLNLWEENVLTTPPQRGAWR